MRSTAWFGTAAVTLGVAVGGCSGRFFPAAPAEVVAVLSGDGQMGLPGAWLPHDLRVQVTDTGGRPAADAPLVASVTLGDALVFGPDRRQVSDRAGRATFRVRLGQAHVHSRISIRMASAGQPGARDTVAHADLFVRTLGDGTFDLEPLPLVPVVAHTDIAVVDLDRDGVDDLVTYARHSASSLDVRFGLPAGGHALQHSIPLPAYTRYHAVGDFDGDGFPDLVLQADCCETPNRFFLVRNDHGRLFREAAAGTPVGQGHGLVAVDLNADARDEVVVLLPEVTGFEVFANGASGATFTSAGVTTLPESPAFFCGADFDSDGRDDLAAVLPATQATWVFWGDATLPLGPPASLALGAGVLVVRAIDLDADGRAELLVARNDNRGILDVWTVAPTRELTLRQTADLSSVTPVDLRAGDFDGDGDTDLLVESYTGDGIYAVWSNDGTGTLTPAAGINPGRSDRRFVAIADINRDGRDDLLRLHRRAIVPMLGTPDAALESTLPATLTLTAPTATLAVDLDDRSPPELVVASADGTLSIFAEPALRTNPTQTVLLPCTPEALAALDLDNDGDLEVAITCRAADGGRELHLLDNDGGSLALTFGLALPPDWQTGRLIALDADFDGLTDLLTTSVAPPARAGMLWNEGDGRLALAPLLDQRMTGNHGLCDLDGDGWADLVTADWTLEARLEIWRQAAPRRFVLTGETGDSAGYRGGNACADFDGDGHADLLDLKPYFGPNLAVQYGDGRGRLREQFGNSELGGENAQVMIGDHNGDGILDFLGQNSRAAWAIYASRGRRDYEIGPLYPDDLPPARFAGGPAPSTEWQRTVADLNEDGVLDLVIPQPAKNALIVVWGRRRR